MSNLLKDASILLTPTAYDNGSMLAVKPSENLYGTEEVTNGDFATDSDWSKNSNWTISGGTANADGSSNNPIFQDNVVIINKTYKVTFTITNISQGAFNLDLGTHQSSITYSSNGTYTEVITAGSGNTRIYFRCSGNAIGSIDNVSVKEDLSGDFQFSRNSAATRVNAQGLVENVQILSSDLVSNGDFSQEGAEEVSNGSFSQEGSELVTNGDFSNGLNGWTLNGGSNGYIDTSSSTLQYLPNHGDYAEVKQLNNSIIGKTYKVNFEVISKGANAVVYIYYGRDAVYIGDIDDISIGLHTAYVTSVHSDGFSISVRTNGIIEIDNVSVKEVGQDWTLAGLTNVVDEAVSFVDNGTNTISSITQSNALSTNKQYKVTFDISRYVLGQIQVILGGLSVINQLSEGVGNYTMYLPSGVSTSFQIKRYGGVPDFDFDITNISVKEVGQDWALGSGWSIGDDKVVSDTTASNLTPSTVLVSGKKYKFTLDVAKLSVGSFTFFLRFNGSNTVVGTVSSEGSLTFYATADAASFRLQNLSGGTTGFSVTNISVKEITDDTNLPRINYEGFSYQDVLGSEEVVNGDFATDSNWVKQAAWSISGGTANSNGSNGSLYQSSVVEIGKSYLCEFEITSITSGSVAINAGGITTGTSRTSIGKYSEKLYVVSGSNDRAYIISQSFNGSIDNVSFKEVLGQEVVPNSGCGSWLMEGQSTNLVTQSEDFSQSVWAKGRVSIIPNTLKSPDGSLNASTLSVTSATGGEEYLRVQSNDTNAATCSFYVKKGNWRYITIRSVNASIFDFDTESFTFTGTDEIVSFDKLQNGWYRLKASSLTRFYCSIGFAANATTPAAGSAVNGTNMYIYGAMLEQNSFATSYIPT